MNTYYNKLMEYQGADELIKLVNQWEILSENLNKRSFDAPIVLPDIFMYTSPGYGNTHLLKIISEYLDSKKNLMSFYGDVKFFEFKLEYCHPDANFRDLYRLIESINQAAGFRNEFKGIISINIDEWVHHHKEKHFHDFLQFLQLNTSYWMIIFTISNTKENEDTKALETVASMYLRLEKITLAMHSDENLVKFASKHLEKYDLKLDDSAKTLLTESVAVLKENEYFCGLHTIIDMCNDIVYSIYSSSTNVSHVITAEMLGDFKSDSDYIKRTIQKSKKISLGF